MKLWSKGIFKIFALLAMLCIVGSVFATSVDVSYLNNPQVQKRYYTNLTLNESVKNPEVTPLNLGAAARIIPILATVARLSYNYAKKFAFKFRYQVIYQPNKHTKIAILIWDKKYSLNSAKKLGMGSVQCERW